MNLRSFITVAGLAFSLGASAQLPSPHHSLTLTPEHSQDDTLLPLYTYDSYINMLTGRSRADVRRELSMKGYAFPLNAAAELRIPLYEEYKKALRYVNETNHFGYYDGSSTDITIPPLPAHSVIILIYRQGKLHEHIVLGFTMPHASHAPLTVNH